MFHYCSAFFFIHCLLFWELHVAAWWCHHTIFLVTVFLLVGLPQINRSTHFGVVADTHGCRRKTRRNMKSCIDQFIHSGWTHFKSWRHVQVVLTVKHQRKKEKKKSVKQNQTHVKSVAVDGKDTSVLWNKQVSNWPSRLLSLQECTTSLFQTPF